MGTKICGLCKTERPLDKYNIDHRSGKPRHMCKVCNVVKVANWKKNNPEKVKESQRATKEKHELKYRLKRCYNMSVKDYKEILNKQNNKCKICKLDQKDHHRVLCVDHCHKTGKIRGILCDKCNSGLGFFKDSIENLEIAINYLKESLV